VGWSVEVEAENTSKAEFENNAEFGGTRNLNLNE
jgi:hypothetical protein